MGRNKINDQLKRLAETKQKNEQRQTAAQQEMMAQMTEQKEDTLDLVAIAEEFKRRNEELATGANEGFTKDTIYIEDSLYIAMQALCLSRGDKKKHVNNAYRDYILKMHKQLKRDVDK